MGYRLVMGALGAIWMITPALADDELISVQQDERGNVTITSLVPSIRLTSIKINERGDCALMPYSLDLLRLPQWYTLEYVTNFSLPGVAKPKLLESVSLKEGDTTRLNALVLGCGNTMINVEVSTDQGKLDFTWSHP